MTTERCPVCGEGSQVRHVQSRILEFNGKKESVNGFLYSICDSCGTEICDADQTRFNKRLVQSFRKRAEGLLVGSEIRAIREHFDLSQQQAARVFGGGIVAFSKYESDDVSQSIAMDRLLRVAFAVPGAFGWLLNYVGLGAGEERKVSIKLEWQFHSKIKEKKPTAAQYDISIPSGYSSRAANMSDYEDAAQSA